MSRTGTVRPGRRPPTLFRQIAARLAAFTLLFAALDVGIVVFTYSRQPESLAQELLTLEAAKAQAGGVLSPDLLAGPPGAESWSVAQVAVAGLESSRSRAMIALADLDRLYAAGATEGTDLAALATARDAAIAQVEQENATISGLLAALQ